MPGLLTGAVTWHLVPVADSAVGRSQMGCFGLVVLLAGQPGECPYGDGPESLDAQWHRGEGGARRRQLFQAG